MKRFINFGSIEQFKQIVKHVQHTARYVGLDADGKVQYNNNAKMPVLKATGNEKIHGTNGAVCYSHADGMWVQSRKNIITPEKDNAGCAFFVDQTENEWMRIIDTLINEYGIDCHKSIVSVYFEFCGGNIQKNSCVTGLDKMAIIFKHFKVSPIDPVQSENDQDGQDEPAIWLDTVGVSSHEHRIYNVHDFPYVELEVDFDRPDLAQNKMVELTEKVESNSGIAHYFNKPSNIGEGYVWTIELENGNILRFKTKGEKHSASNVKTLKPVDSAKEQVKIDFANYATPAWRLEQAWQTVFGIANEKREPDIKATGDFLRAVMADVMKEELDTMSEKGLEPKEVNSYIAKVAKQWFTEELAKY